MKVADLIAALKHMPEDAEVFYIWDGEPRSTVEHVWHSRRGDVMLCDADSVVYSTDARSHDAPGEEEQYWRSPAAGSQDK